MKLTINSNALDLHKRKCKQCGKEFECSTQYVYKRYRSDSRKLYHYFCSYSCLREYDKEKEAKKRSRYA